MQPRDIPVQLHARYGIRPPSRWRWLGWALAALVVLPIGTYAASRYVVTQSATYSLSSWSWQARSHSATATLRTTASIDVQWCAIRAQDFDRFDVGYAVVRVPRAAMNTSFRLALLAEPVIIEVVDCASDPYSLPGPQFRPGLQAPVQRPPALTPGVYSPQALAALS